MKLSKETLKQIIKEELESVMQEIEAPEEGAGYDEAAAIEELNAALAEPMIAKK